MATEESVFIADDYLTFQTKRFAGRVGLAASARRQFLNTPGFISFEVSPFTGQVFIGVDRKVLMRQDAKGAAVKLLTEYFPGLLASAQFSRAYPSIH
ncbi:MAG: hypothetical protein PHR30_01950 [Gallionellaceae bacterium]|nr:hypothetical protein [Gallionellaceae bacterium]